MSTVRTFADALRAARERHAALQAQGLARFAALQDGDAEGPPAPAIDPELAALEARIVPPRSDNPNLANPKVRCDYCPSVQQADMMHEAEPGLYACDACRWKWSVTQSASQP